MKSLCRWFTFLAFTVGCSALVFAQAVPPNISLDVRPMTAGGAVNSANFADVGRKVDYDSNTVTQGGNYGSTRQRSSSISVEISLHNFRPNEQDAVVRTLFFVKGTQRNSSPTLQTVVATPLKLPATGGTKTTATSKPASSVTKRTFSEATTTNPYQTRKYTATASNTTEGEKMFGWVVALEVNGHIIRTRTANPTLEALLRDPKWIYQTVGLPLPSAAPAIEPAAPDVPGAAVAVQPAVPAAATVSRPAAPAGARPPTPPTLD
jgi:hypothetical protein